MADTGFNVNNKSDLLGYIFIHLYLFMLNNTHARITENERLHFTLKWGGGVEFWWTDSMSRQAARPSAWQSNFVQSSRKIVGAFRVLLFSLDTNWTFREIKSQEQSVKLTLTLTVIPRVFVYVCVFLQVMWAALWTPTDQVSVITVTITISVIINIFFFLLTVIKWLLLKVFVKKFHSKFRLFPVRGIPDVTEVLVLRFSKF